MPQASDDLRQRMVDRFGDIGDGPPAQFLIDAGYKLSRGYTWSKPGISAYGQMTRDEFECLMFLMHEWDWGGLDNDKDRTHD